MRINELLTEEEMLNEGWREWLSAALMAGVMGYGASKMPDTDQTQSAAKQDTSIDIKPVKKDIKPVKKDIKPITKNTVSKKDTKLSSSQREEFVKNAAIKAGLKGDELIAFVSQIAHESWNFTKMKEKNAAKRIETYRTKDDVGNIVDRKGRLLNKKPSSKTGYVLNHDLKTPAWPDWKKTKENAKKYIGRGFIQITGYDNYRRYKKAAGVDIVKNPELAEQPDVAIKIALAYWKNRVKPKVSDFSDVKDVTKQINPSMNGLSDRKEKFKKFRIALNNQNFS